jgi:predicted negative regulator of RcsB-dependent stress response
VLAQVLDEGERSGLASIVSYARVSYGAVLTARGRFAEAKGPIERALAQFVAEGNQRNETGARNALAALHLEAGDLAAAEAEARRGAAIGVAPTLAASARATLARVLCATGRAAEALAMLDAAPPSAELYWLAARVEALAAAGRTDLARDEAARALAQLAAIAARIGDPARRAQFTGELPHNARLARLAAALGATPAARDATAAR